MVIEDLVDLVLAYGDSTQREWTALEHDGQTISNRQLRESMLRAGTMLARGQGVLVVCDPDPLTHTIAALGALACGRIPMLVDSRLPDSGVLKAAARAGASQIVGRPLPGLELLEPDALISESPMEPRRFPDDSIGTIFLTSGSTGEPKLVQRTRRADLHGTMGMRISDLPMASGDRFWIPVPHSSIAWVSLLHAMFIARMTSVFAPFDKSDPGTFLAERDIQSAYMVPTMIRLARQHAGLDHPAWLRLRFLMIGGEKLDDATRDDLTDTLGDRLYMGYGMTESPRVCEARPQDLRERPGTVGRPLAFRQFMIADPGTFDPVPVGEEGDVLVRSPELFLGYLGEEPCGEWHPTGDVGRADEDGFLYITGRAGSVLKIGGNRLSTEEVSTALRSHPQIDQAAVVAAPDPVWTHRLHAFVVVNGEGIDSRSLEGWLRERLPAYKVPRGFTILPELPQDSSGKLSLTTLRRLADAAK